MAKYSFCNKRALHTAQWRCKLNFFLILFCMTSELPTAFLTQAIRRFMPRACSAGYEVVTIYHGDNNTCIFLFPKMKAACKTQAPPSMKNLFETMAANQVGRISIGVETLQGITCRKSLLNSDCPHPTTIATEWENEKSGAPVALEVGRTNQIVHLQILSYSTGPQPSSQFEIPPGYTDYPTYIDILQEARKRFVHASAH
jgi:hypothetical protein